MNNDSSNELLKFIKHISIYNYSGNPMLINYEDWLENKSMENNFMDYKVKTAIPKFICNGKYEIEKTNKKITKEI